MKIAGVIKNDVVNGYDVCVSVWVQGCPFHCKGCHNPTTWDPEGGYDINPDEFIEQVIEELRANNIHRNLSILGGEPLCDTNDLFVKDLLLKVKEAYPDICIFLWTGYKWEELNSVQKEVVSLADVVIDGRFRLEERDITLPYRGSPNQRIIDVKETLKSGVPVTRDYLIEDYK